MLAAGDGRSMDCFVCLYAFRQSRKYCTDIKFCFCIIEIQQYVVIFYDRTKRLRRSPQAAVVAWTLCLSICISAKPKILQGQLNLCFCIIGIQQYVVISYDTKKIHPKVSLPRQPMQISTKQSKEHGRKCALMKMFHELFRAFIWTAEHTAI